MDARNAFGLCEYVGGLIAWFACVWVVDLDNIILLLGAITLTLLGLQSLNNANYNKKIVKLESRIEEMEARVTELESKHD